MPFRDPIVSGEDLAVNAIQSEGYVAGTIGWRIERNGNASFNDLNVRGEFTNTGLNQQARMHDGLFLVESLVNSRFVTVEEDGVYFTGVDGAAQDKASILMDDATNGQLGLFNRLNLGVAIKADTGFLYAAEAAGGSGSAFTLNDWVQLSLSNGWTHLAGNALEYKLMPDGTVIIDGIITGGTTAPGTLLGTLPAGYRPRKVPRLILPSESSTTQDWTILVNNSTGAITIGRSANAGARIYFNSCVLATI